jgi:hypothetical protein
MYFSNSLLALASAASAVTALGINCQGSGLCASNDGILNTALGQLRGMDQNQQFSDGQHIVCVESPVTITNPSLCLFYQMTGRSWTVSQTVWFVQSLLDHGCGACGSIPTDSGNDVNNGELTANMVTDARRDLKAISDVPRDMGMVKVMKKSAKPAVKQAVNRREPVMKLSKRLGINCEGSSTCGVGGAAGTPAGTIDDLRNSIAGGPDGAWGNGQQVGCIAHATGRLCAFYQNIGDRTFNQAQTLMYLQWLLDHSCRVCGSVPTDDGNDVNNGELTVNYVG